MKHKIGVLDSGIGGLTVLEELKRVLPREDFLYYGDHLHNPYGEKSKEELLEIIGSIVLYFKKQGCRIIVLACNTATTMCMKELRDLYPELIFVGTVPAIKMACDNLCKNTIVMATPATVQSERTQELIRDNLLKEQHIYLIPCTGLADAIEVNNSILIQEILEDILTKYQEIAIDSIVLGCTHYPWIKKDILKILPGVRFFDGANGVAREVKYQLEFHHLQAKGTELGETIILESLDEE